MSDHKQTIDICNISPSYHRPPSHEEQGQQKRSEWDGDPKITIPSTNDNPPPPPLKQHNHTIKAPLPFPHCLISAGYLRYLCGSSYLWPSACCFVVTPPSPPPPSTHLPAPTPHASVLRPSEGCHYSLTHLTIPSCGMCICRIAADLHSMGWGEVLTEIWLDTLYQMGKDEDETAAGAVVSNLAVIE